MDVTSLDPDRLSVVALLVFNLVLLVRGDLVPRYVLNLVLSDRDRYRSIAERNSGQANQAITVADRVLP